jgi:tRNA-uridine 2-sulfurtransferase
MKDKSKKRVVVAMSGGVDSSVAACLLVKEGYEVIGITLRLFDARPDESSACCGIQGIEDARGVAARLDIPFYALNDKKEFEKKVIDIFSEEYANGRTPNPCVVCNCKIKFGSLLAKAKTIDADNIATGHYARVEYDHDSGRYLLKKGSDRKKDQSYFLHGLSQEQLKHVLFPLGELTKDEVRAIARKFELKVHNKPGSQEICFIPDDDYKNYLLKRDPSLSKKGKITDSHGKILGYHRGIAFYTVGQRKGLGISSLSPLYVARIDAEKNTIVVGEESGLYSTELTASKMNWISCPAPEKPMPVSACIRYNHIPEEAMVFPVSKDRIKVVFSKPQRAVTPGQSVVFYDNDIVVAGGIID